MATLVEKLRKARESTVDVAGFRFTIRRPTDLEMIDIRNNGTTASLLAFVIGWAKSDGTPITEIELGLPGGEPHPLAFDLDACTDFLADRFDLLLPVTQAIADAFKAHAEAMGDATKN